MLRWVSPESMGVWQTLLVLESYLMVLRFGVVNAMNRNYPFLLGKGDYPNAFLTVQVAAFHTALVGACLLVTFLSIGLYYGYVQDEEWMFASFSFGFYSVSSLYQSFVDGTLRGGHHFSVLSRLQLISIVLNVTSLPIVVVGGFYGYCLRQSGLALVLVALFRLCRPIRERAKPNWAFFRRLLTVGFPLFVSNYLTRLGNTIGQLAILYIGGQHLLGLFVPVAAVGNCFASLPSVFSIYFLPHQNFEYGRTGDAPLIVRRALRTGIVVSLAVLPVSLLGWFFLPQIAQWVFPMYAASGTAMRVAALTGVLQAFGIATTCYSTLKAWRFMFVNLAFLLVTQLLGVGLCVSYFPYSALEAVAWGSLLGQVAYVALTIANLRLMSTKFNSLEE